MLGVGCRGRGTERRGRRSLRFSAIVWQMGHGRSMTAPTILGWVWGVGAGARNDRGVVPYICSDISRINRRERCPHRSVWRYIVRSLLGRGRTGASFPTVFCDCCREGKGGTRREGGGPGGGGGVGGWA